MRVQLDRKAMATLSGGHLAVDFASGAVPALLPFFVLEFHLSYTATAGLMLAVLASSSLVQPLFGLWSDRRGTAWLLPAGVGIAGLAMGVAAVAPSYGLVLALVFLAGLGIAAYHPDGAKFAAFASGRRRASGMSLFNIGGNTGYALGPIVVTPLVLWLGLEGGLVAMVPVVLVSVLLFLRLPRLARLVPAPDDSLSGRGADNIRAMALLGVVIALRSDAWFGLLTFVPLWVVSNGGTEGEGNRELSLMLLAGAAGTLVLGPVADRVGLRRLLVATQAVLPVLIVVYVAVGGVPGTLSLMLVGLCVVGTFGVTMVLSQLYLPRHVGVASGLSVGLAMGLGGVAAVALGAVADAVDLEAALYAGAAAPGLGCLICLLLPAPPRVPSPVVAPAPTA